MKVKDHKQEEMVMSRKLLHSQTSYIDTKIQYKRRYLMTTSSDISFREHDVRLKSYVKVTDVEVSAFSECFMCVFVCVCVCVSVCVFLCVCVFLSSKQEIPTTSIKKD